MFIFFILKKHWKKPMFYRYKKNKFVFKKIFRIFKNSGFPDNRKNPLIPLYSVLLLSHSTQYHH